MNTPAPATLGLATGATLGGFGVSAPTGLEGLFALLLGGNQPGATGNGLPTGLLDALLKQTETPLGNDTLLGLLPQNVLEQLDTGDAKSLSAQLANLFANQGEPGAEELQATMQVNLQAVVVEIQQITVQLTEGGIDLSSLGSSQDLAAAFIQLGMPPEEAAMKAAQIDTMLQLVRQMLDVPDDATPGDLMAQILAASGALANMGQAPVVQVEAQITTASAEVAVVQVQVSHHHARARLAAQNNATGADLARGMAGISPLEGEADTTLPAANTVQPVAPDAETLGAEADALPDADILVTDAPVQAAPAAPVQTPQAAPAANTQPSERPIMVENTPTVQAVEAGKEIAAPKGTEVLRATVDDQDNLQVERKVDAMTLREAPVHNPPPPPPAKEVAPAPFAERLAHATRHESTQQVVVQIKELAGQGGGVVRMILNPPELGEIRIEMVVIGGKVEGSISATDGAVVELLARDVHSLKQGLGELGLKLGDNGLTLMLGQNNQQQAQQDQRGQQPQHNQQGWNGGAGTDDGQLPEPAVATRWVSPDRVLDMNV